MGRRGIKEYRASEALALIAADRDQQPLVCPCCGSAAVTRTPRRPSKATRPEAGKITLQCNACSRTAGYLPTAASDEPVITPESPASRRR